jgi:hypothetical protein
VANIDHIMPKPVVVPIFWGHDYVANRSTAERLTRLLLELVTGSFMNGLAQYGIHRGTVRAPALVDDQAPPRTLTYIDRNNKMTDEVTAQLKTWITQGIVPAPPTPNDINQFYMIFPPSQTTFQTFNGSDDPIGNGVQGLHNEGLTNPAPPPTLYWAIVKTNDVGPASDAVGFVNGLGPKVSHELVEQLADRNGLFQEIGDPCVGEVFDYHGFTVERYRSMWHSSADHPDGRCVKGDDPVNLRRFLTATRFDVERNGLRALGASTINVNLIASRMESE